MAALMVRVSRTDGHYTEVEKHRVDAMLVERYRLAPAAAARVRGEAEIAEAGAQDTVQFTRLIKEAVPYDERVGVVEALWRIAAADGINTDERGLMRLVANLLGVSDVDSAPGAAAGARGEPVAGTAAVGPGPGAAREGRDEGARGAAGAALGGHEARQLRADDPVRADEGATRGMGGEHLVAEQAQRHDVRVRPAAVGGRGHEASAAGGGFGRLSSSSSSGSCGSSSAGSSGGVFSAGCGSPTGSPSW